jgi:carboxypeptidase PM20D1
LEGAAATNAMLRTTTAPTIVRGGVKDNVLPSEANATINFRILPGETVDSVIERVTTVIDDPDVTVEKYGDSNNPSAVSSAGSESFEILQRSIREALPDTVVAPSLVIAGTDTKHYEALAENAFRFLPMRLGPDDLGRIHGTNERITLENYAELIRFYVQLVRNSAL